MSAPTAAVVSRRELAEEAARTLAEHLGPCATASAYHLDRSWYVVTSGTGEGIFAYDADDVEALDLDAGYESVPADECGDAAGEELDEDGRTRRWSYTEWCSTSSAEISEDVRVAVAYYLATGEHLCCAGTCSHVLSDRDVEIVRAVTRP